MRRFAWLLISSVIQEQALAFPGSSLQSESKSLTTGPATVKQCFVKASMLGISDSLLAASKECRSNAHITIEAGHSLIDKVVVLQNLNNVELTIKGTLNIMDDWSYWAQNAYSGIKADQNVTSMITFLHGKNINVNGWGTIDSKGESCWRGYNKDNTFKRSLLVLFHDVVGGSYSQMRHINPCFWNLYFYLSHNMKVHDYQVDLLDGGAGSINEAKNTDGVNFRDSSNIEVFHARIGNTDDVVALKDGSENIWVHDVIGDYRCGGISAGSLGNRIEKFETVRNSTINNVELRKCRSGPRVKAWSGLRSSINELAGGGGSGLLDGMTFRDINLKDTEVGIIGNRTSI